MKTISRKIAAGVATDLGRKRRPGPNQDSVAIAMPDLFHPQSPIFLIADGMGGHAGGAVASRLIINSFLEEYRNSWQSEKVPELLEICIQKTHATLRKYALDHPDLREMGSTIVAAVVHDGRIYVTNVGDSRAYLCRGDAIIQLSTDQSWVQEEVQAGRLTVEEAAVHKKRNVLTMSITAMRDKITSIHNELEVEPEDTIILCTDGLWSVVPNSIIYAVAMELPPERAASKLVELANASVSKDNISVIIATWRDPRCSPRNEMLKGNEEKTSS